VQEDQDQIERLAAAGDVIDFDGKQVVSAAVDIRDKASVWTAAEGSSHLVICAVSRWQRRSSFDVNMRGVMNGVTAAIAAGQSRLTSLVHVCTMSALFLFFCLLHSPISF